MIEGMILASGMGSRLGSIARGVKFRVTVAGIPLICYPARSLIKAGANRLIIVVRKGTEKLLLDSLTPLGRVNLEVVSNPHPQRENGYSFLLGLRRVQAERILVSMSDHIFHPEIPRRLFGYLGALIAAGDRRPRYIDVREATKILADGQGNIIRVGKNLEKYTHIDAGVFLVHRRVLNIVEGMERELKVIRFSDVVNRIVAEGWRARIADVTGLPWTEIDTPEDYLDAERGRRREVVRTVWGAL